MIAVEQVSKSFGSLQALKEISFQIGRGEVVGFLGPNGAGKTTLMRLLTGFFPPTRGRIMIDGQDLFGAKAKARKKIGYLAENNPLYRDMRVKEFLGFAASLKGLGGSKHRKALEETAQQCGLTEVLGRTIGKLSKGYQQRVGLAQALIGKPEILILDEPTNGLDPQQTVEIRELIRRLGQEQTIILSSHLLPEVQMMCGRVLIINGGRLVTNMELGDLKRTECDLEKIFLEALCQKP